MKRLAPKFKFLLPTIVLLFQITTTPTLAADFCKLTLLDKPETLDTLPWITTKHAKPLFRAATDITVRDTVNNDAYLVGHIINVDSTIDGDLLALGSIINIAGTVTQDVRILGGIVNISGTVGRNVTILGGSVNIAPTAVIKGDVINVGKKLVFGGSSSGLLKFTGEEATISGIVGQDAEIYAYKVQLDDKAVIKRKLFLLKDSGIQSKRFSKISTQKLPSPFKATEYLVVLFIGLLLNKFAHRQLKAVTKLTKKNFKNNALTGFVVLLIAPVIIGLLALSIIGIPIAIVLATMFVMFFAFYEIPVALALGNFIFDKLDYTKKAEDKKKLWKPDESWHLAVGLFFVQFLFRIPVVGGVTKFVVVLVTTGALVTFSKHAHIRLQKRK